MRLTDTQFYYLKKLVNGPVPFSELSKWDQRPLRGLFLRGLFDFSTMLDGRATKLGWTIYQGTLKPKLRREENWKNPLFGNRSLSREVPKRRLTR